MVKEEFFNCICINFSLLESRMTKFDRIIIHFTLLSMSQRTTMIYISLPTSYEIFYGSKTQRK